MRLARTLCLFYLILCIPNLWGQWNKDVSALLEHEDLKSALVALDVRDLDGHSLLSHNHDIGLMPASTLKLVTTLGAIDIMGSEYKYHTQVGYLGEIGSDGTLYGDLVVIGSGDPSLGSDQDRRAVSMQDQFLSIVRAVSAHISCVEGKLLIDASIFDDVAVHRSWAWDDLCNYYATGVWGLNLHENLYYLSFDRSMTPGSHTTISEIQPAVHGLQMNNQVSIGSIGSADEAYLYGDPYSLLRSVQGTIPPGTTNFTIKGAIPDSRVWFAEHLLDRLRDVGLNIQDYEIVDQSIGKIHPLLTIKSSPLKDLIQHANAISDNLYCDAFYKTIGAWQVGKGSWHNARSGMMEYLQCLGVNTAAYHQEDGSGLSMRNRVSAAFMTDFLTRQITNLTIDTIKYLLPRAGVQGSVKSFLNGYEAQPHAWLKSGSIDAVVAYAGVLQISQEEHVVFYIASNGHQKSNRTIRKHFEKIIDTIYRSLKS